MIQSLYQHHPLEFQIVAAVLLDALLGDPRWLPHPVRGIGWFAARVETLARKTGAALARPLGIPAPLLALGIFSEIVIVGGSAALAWALIFAAGKLHPLAADAVSVLLIYTTVAARDLADHAVGVYGPLRAGDLPLARRKVAMIVGRDTDTLDEPGIVRAAVESVAESTVDGVTAPLFFAVLGGPVAAVAYRAVNTLDSMFGHKDDRYLKFGWAAARLDDLANYIPARLSAAGMVLSAALLGRRPRASLRILLRDGRKHESPNSGLTEAAMAGALGVQLGGVNFYGGQPLPKPCIGEAVFPLRPSHISWAIAMMWATSVVFLAACIAVRLGVAGLSGR